MGRTKKFPLLTEFLGPRVAQMLIGFGRELRKIKDAANTL